MNWKQAVIRVIGYIAMIISGILTQLTTNNPIATFAVSFIIGFAVSKISGRLATKKTNRRPSHGTSRAPTRASYVESQTPSHQRSTSYATPPGFEPKSFKTKYMGGHSSHPKGTKVTLNLLGDRIEVPELRLNIPYHAIRDVEAIAKKGLKNLAFEATDFLGIIALVGLYWAIRIWSGRQKSYIKITYVDGRGTTQTPAFNLSQVSEVQPLIYRMMTYTRARPTGQSPPPTLIQTTPSQSPTGPALIPAQQYTPKATRLPEPPPTLRAPERPFQVPPTQETAPKIPPPKPRAKPKSYMSKELMAAYRNMREQYEMELITEDRYANYVQGLRFADDSGKPWIIGSESGSWYTHDGVSWRPGEPPERLIRTE